MEIRNIQDIDNREYRSQIREITAITNDPNVVAGTTVDNCLNEVFILLKNGDYDHFVANPNDINARTEETTDFLRLLENWGNQTGVTLSAPYFTQLSLGTQNKDKKRAIKEIRADYRDYLKSNSSDDEYDDEDAKKPLSLGKKAAIAAGTVGLATAIGVGGVAGYNHFKNRDDASIEVQTDEAQGFDLNLEGKDFAYYENDANIPASLQKDFALRNSDSPYNFLTSFNSTSTVDGQTYKTGYTYRQLFYADIFFNGNSYSNDELLTILGNYDIMADQFDENNELKISFKNEIDGFLYSTIATAMDTPTKLTQVFNLIKDDDARAKALESVPLMENLMTAIKNDSGVKDAKEAYEKWLTDSFLEDVTETTTGDRKYQAVDLSANQALQFVVNSEIAAISLTSNPINDDIAEILVSGQNGNQSMTNSANEALYGRLENFAEYRKQMIDEDQSTDDLNEYKALLLADKSEKEKQKIIEQNPSISFSAEQSGYDQLTEKTCDVDQIIRIMSDQLKILGKEPTRDEQDQYLGAIINYYLEKQIGDIKSYSSGSGNSSKKSNTQTVIDDTKGTPQEKREQAIAASSEPLVDAAELAENIRKDILGSVVTPEDEAETTKKAQANANEQAKLDSAAWYKIYNEAYAWYSVYGEKNGEALNAYLYANSNKKIGDSTGSKETTEAYAWQQGKLGGLEYYYNNHKEEAITGGEIQDDTLEDLKDQNVDVDNVSTDKGNSSGQTIEDIINQGNSEDPNKGNTVPGGDSGQSVIPPSPDELNGKENSTSNSSANGEQETITPPSDVQPGESQLPDNTPDGWHGFEDDSVTDGMTQNPDGTFGGETQIDNAVQESLNMQSAPETSAVEATPAVAETAPSTTVDQAIDAVVEETAQQIYEEQTMGGEAIIYEGLEDYISNLGEEEVITPEETEAVKSMK